MSRRTPPGSSSTGATDTENKKSASRTILPPVESWPHRPVLVKASDDTKILGRSEHEALPIGVPFEFETPLFKGRILLRLRHATSDEMTSHEAYFSGRKRLMQTVVQGRFKKAMGMDEVYMGSLFSEPLRLVPPPSIARMIKAMVGRYGNGFGFGKTEDCHFVRGDNTNIQR